MQAMATEADTKHVRCTGRLTCRQGREAIPLEMAAQDYPLRDITRMGRVLDELAAQSPADDEVLRFRVTPAEVHIELLGPVVERIVLQKRWNLTWMRFQRYGERLSLLSCRMIH